MDSDYLMEKKVEVQLDLFTAKLMTELKAIKDELKGTRDQINIISKTITSTPQHGASIPSSQPIRQDFQVSQPRQQPQSSYGNFEGAPTQGYNQYPQQQQQFVQQQPPQQVYQQQPPQQPQMDTQQGGFTGASMAQSTRGRGTNLAPNLSMDKVFYCGGKR
jgi:hypothetical protein